MKKKLLNLLAERKEIYLTELPELMPEIKGKYSAYMPVKKGVNPNILWLAGVTQDFIKVFSDLLIEDKSIDWKPQDIFFLLVDGKPIYRDIPLAKQKSIKSKKECWLPVSIMLAEKKMKKIIQMCFLINMKTMLKNVKKC